MQRAGFIIGWLFFLLAFMAAAAENVLSDQMLMSTDHLLRALDPGKWIATKAKLSSPFFDYLILPLLALPGWLLCGVPAGLLLWFCRPHKEKIDPELEDSLRTYDRLVKLAEEENAVDDHPRYQDLKPEDYEELADLPDGEVNINQYLKDWHPPPVEEDTAPSEPASLEERIEQTRQTLSIPSDKFK